MGLIPAKTDCIATERLLYFLEIASHSAGPYDDHDTESVFEDQRTWSPPAARVEAAKSLPFLVKQRPDLLTQLSDQIDRLLSDPHPSRKTIGRVACTGSLEI